MSNAKNTPRKSWNFGHFGTRHDGIQWNLVRIKSADGTKLDTEEVVRSSKSATPLVVFARIETALEKRDTRREFIRREIVALTDELAEIELQCSVAESIIEDVKVQAETVLSGKALKARAKELGIKGRGKMSADELRGAVAAA